MQKEKKQYSWLRDILKQASEEVKSWPTWMQQPEMRNIYNTEREQIGGCCNAA